MTASNVTFLSSRSDDNSFQGEESFPEPEVDESDIPF